MRRPPRWTWALLVILTLGGTACQLSNEDRQAATAPSPGGEAADTNVDTHAEAPYYFRLNYVDMWGVATVTINGFPVHESGGGRIVANPPLRLALATGLVRGENDVQVAVEPMILRPAQDGVRTGPVRLGGQVVRGYSSQTSVDGGQLSVAAVDSAHAAWAERATGRFDSLRSIGVGRSAALDSVRTWARAHPMTVSVTFDNAAGPDFSALFEEAPVIAGTAADSARLRDYAMRLSDHFAERDTQAIYRHHAPKFDAIGFSKQEAMDVIATDWLTFHWRTDVRRADVGMTRWAGGRIWELYRTDERSRSTGKQGLLYAGEQAFTTWHAVYVAEMDGDLRVVR